MSRKAYQLEQIAEDSFVKLIPIILGFLVTMVGYKAFLTCYLEKVCDRYLLHQVNHFKSKRILVEKYI